MEPTLRVTLNTVELDRIVAQSGMKLERILVRAAFEVERIAKQHTPVDTGALRASIYTRTRTGGSAPIKAISGRYVRRKAGSRTKSGTLRSSVASRTFTELPAPSGDVVAVVGPGMDYAAFVEYGTRGRAGRFYMLRAAEEVERKMNSGETFKEIVE